MFDLMFALVVVTSPVWFAVLASVISDKLEDISAAKVTRVNKVLRKTSLGWAWVAEGSVLDKR